MFGLLFMPGLTAVPIATLHRMGRGSPTVAVGLPDSDTIVNDGTGDRLPRITNPDIGETIQLHSKSSPVVGRHSWPTAPSVAADGAA
jgi:hypothetical protein